MPRIQRNITTRQTRHQRRNHIAQHNNIRQGRAGRANARRRQARRRRDHKVGNRGVDVAHGTEHNIATAGSYARLAAEHREAVGSVGSLHPYRIAQRIDRRALRCRNQTIAALSRVSSTAVKPHPGARDGCHRRRRAGQGDVALRDRSCRGGAKRTAGGNHARGLRDRAGRPQIEVTGRRQHTAGLGHPANAGCHRTRIARNTTARANRERPVRCRQPRRLAERHRGQTDGRSAASGRDHPAGLAECAAANCDGWTDAATCRDRPAGEAHAPCGIDRHRRGIHDATRLHISAGGGDGQHTSRRNHRRAAVGNRDIARAGRRQRHRAGTAIADRPVDDEIPAIHQAERCPRHEAAAPGQDPGLAIHRKRQAIDQTDTPVGHEILHRRDRIAALAQHQAADSAGQSRHRERRTGRLGDGAAGLQIKRIRGRRIACPQIDRTGNINRAAPCHAIDRTDPQRRRIQPIGRHIEPELPRRARRPKGNRPPRCARRQFKNPGAGMHRTTAIRRQTVRFDRNRPATHNRQNARRYTVTQRNTTGGTVGQTDRLAGRRRGNRP